MFTLPALPYDAAALEPHIDAQTMQIHHDKHHQAYIDKLNAAIQGTEWEHKSIEELLTNLSSLPENIRGAVRNHGGGHYNHSLFWTSLSGQGGGEPTGELAQAIRTTFGSFAAFQEQFAAAATSQFGSGWAWLVKTTGGELQIQATPNQDNPRMSDPTLTVLLGIDVWEHAYYLKYQNRRPDYISAWWKVVNWLEVEQRWQQ